MSMLNNKLETGIFDGLLSGNCGYFVVLHNKNLQVDTRVQIYRNTAEFEEGTIIKNSVIALLFFLKFIHY